ncbi:GreA/GreB family elongation factor [Candidatus Dojkabacteria bacterium]|nr:GreA/GreB family elongation factor [Candidatus Dojkabacteria bacterium]
MKKSTGQAFSRASVGILNAAKKKQLIAQTEFKISGIIKELNYLQKEKDEESMIRMSNLTQERDRLLEKLDELKRSKTYVPKENEASKRSVNVGDTVKLNNGIDELELSLVGDFEADSTNGAISVASPLGSSLLNRAVGEAFSVLTPAGQADYEILAIN